MVKKMRFIIKKSTVRKLQLYFSSILIYGIALLIFEFIPYYVKFLWIETHKFLFWLFVGYIFISPFYYHFVADKNTENKQFIFVRAVKKFFMNITRAKNPGFEKKEKVAILFVFFKGAYIHLYKI